MMPYLIQIAFLLQGIAAVLCVIRMIRGPDAVDRVIALDLLALTLGGMIAIHAVSSEKEEFLDAILVLSIIAFIGTIVLARYIEGYLKKRWR